MPSKPRANRPAPNGSRSRCPISLSLELFGDRWTLLILRDVVFAARRHYRDFLQAEEGIASNILADRLRLLVREGILRKGDDPTHKQKALYSLTERGIQLVPVLVQIGTWGSRWLPASDPLSAQARHLVEGGPALLDAFMAQLREEHLGTTRTRAQRGKG